MKLKFSKMHGLGNDFVVLDNVTQKIFLSPEQIKKLADRHFGVGFDQLLMVESPKDPSHDFVYRIFNASGEEVGQCGNGARCLARFIRDKKLSDKDTLRFATHSQKVSVSFVSNNSFCVAMGVPEFTPSKIPFLVQEEEKIYSIKEGSRTLQAIVLSLGNPHMVILDELEDSVIDMLGPKLMQHQQFPEGVNVEFLRIIDPKNIRLRVYERGAGETYACGSGACAAVVAGHLLNKLSDDVNVHVRGGILQVSWSGEGDVTQTGPTMFVYDAELDDNFFAIKQNL